MCRCMCDPAKAREILISFMSVEMLLALKLVFDALDFFTEKAAHLIAECVRFFRACYLIPDGFL